MNIIGRPGPRSFSAHIGYLFNEETSLDARIGQAAAAGFAAVEHPAPYALPAGKFSAALRSAGIGVAQIGTPPGDIAGGEKGFAALPGREDAFRAGLEQALDYAAAIGAPYVHVLSGVCPPDLPRVESWAVYRRNLELAAELAASQNLSILVEPIGIGTLPNYFMNRADMALRLLDEVQAPNLRILLDTFHMANDGLDAADFVARHAHRIGHVHIADFPGRHEPGTGQLDFGRFYAALADADYAGFIGCEYLPVAETRAGLGWMASAVASASSLARGT